MRRLTLILSDLYLHEDAMPAAASTPPAMPALEWLLQVADPPVQIADWRTWLLLQMRGQAREIQVTSHCACGIVPGEQLDTTWFATPVQFEVRIDHARLADRGLVRLDQNERAAACVEFSRAIGAPYELFDGGERTFYVTGITSVAARTSDPARLLGSDVGAALPDREATELRRLGSEIEMWLHGAAFNKSRERAGKRMLSSLWLWRGPAPEPHGPPNATGIEAEFRGGDPLIAALARHQDQRVRGVPKAFSQLESGPAHVVSEFAPLTGDPHERLSALEEYWFAPARTALQSGALREIEIVANDRVFRITSGARWRFWRRKAHWLARLGGNTKA